jgi:putative membrane protein
LRGAFSFDGPICFTVHRQEHGKKYYAEACARGWEGAMNYDEIQTAKTAKDKAGDNQSLTTYAETLKGDHEANQEAVKALSSQKNVKLESVPSEIDQKVKALDKLDNGAFNYAFLRDEVADHEKALSSFKSACSEFKEDPDVQLYIDQTIPILKAHLEMAKNLESQVGTNSNENPANHKKHAMT